MGRILTHLWGVIGVEFSWKKCLLAYMGLSYGFWWKLAKEKVISVLENGKQARNTCNERGRMNLACILYVYGERNSMKIMNGFVIII